ncbi:MAG: hypothetical protein IKR49_06690 [Clostridia bacterium]|jgi:hypothetical protein|nr:hypothetical protein [Clostridia bacterium]
MVFIFLAIVCPPLIWLQKILLYFAVDKQAGFSDYNQLHVIVSRIKKDVKRYGKKNVRKVLEDSKRAQKNGAKESPRKR